jgi:hypothetical protein
MAVGIDVDVGVSTEEIGAVLLRRWKVRNNSKAEHYGADMGMYIFLSTELS